MEVIFGALGIAGGLLCLAGDWLLDCKGKGNRTLGKYRYIESNWGKMAAWRFRVSTLLAAAGVPLYFLGCTSLAMQISNKPLAVGYWVVCVIGSAGGVFIHGLLCVFPVLYQTISPGRSFEETENALNIIYNMVKVPFFFHYVFLVVISSLLAACALIGNALALPVWFAVLTPLGTLMIGFLLKGIFKRDFPGITSFGLAMTGLTAILNYTAQVV